MARPPLRISQKIIVPLCAVMILFAAFTFSGLPDGVSGGGRMFTSFRVPVRGPPSKEELCCIQC